MRKNRILAAAAAAVSLTTVVAACGSGGKGGTSAGGGSKAGYNAASTTIVNPSTKTGGTLKLATASDFDSPDGGDTYYAWVQNFATYYTRPLTTFTRTPGPGGNVVVGDLATNAGEVSADGLTWTYHLRPGVKYEDGTPVTSADVKYALERSNWGQDTLKNGPNYLSSGLVQDTTKYKGPYLDKNPADGVSGITTPDSSTIVIKLNAPFADLPQVLTFPGSSPVPRGKDTGSQYKLHPESVGPYMFDGNYQVGKNLDLKKNPNWDPATDPLKLHPQRLDAVDLQIGLTQDDLDKQLLAGTIYMDAQGAGVGAAAQTQILQNPSQKAQADSALTGREWYAQLNTQIAPFNNIDCRKAVEWLLDKTPLQNAYGGPVTGDIASTLMPPNMAGYAKFDLYPASGAPGTGNLAMAKQEMAKCNPSGAPINTVITARTERQHEIDAATSIKAQLAQIGINADVQTHPTKQYYTNYAGSPAWANANNAGIMMSGWQPDWNDGYGMMYQLVTKAGIHQQGGGTNLSQFSNPQIEQWFQQATATNDATARDKFWGQIDKQNMADATLIPEVYVKTLSYRSPMLTNVYVWQAYGIYDLSQIGVG